MNNNFQFEFNKYINQKRLLKKIFDETLIAVNEIAISEYFTKGRPRSDGTVGDERTRGPSAECPLSAIPEMALTYRSALSPQRLLDTDMSAMLLENEIQRLPQL